MLATALKILAHQRAKFTLFMILFNAANVSRSTFAIKQRPFIFITLTGWDAADTLNGSEACCNHYLQREA